MTQRKLWQRIIPANFEDPWGLLRRLLRSRDPAALFAITSTLLSAVLTPVDLALAAQERRLYARAGAPKRPVILVTGAPRSGTTLLSQALIAQLPVSYFNNLTALFPRAPIVANRLLGRWLPRPAPTFRSFYGRTSGLAAENDGLHLWDRWMGAHRWRLPERLDDEAADAMRRFFGAYEAAFGRPVLNKNNGLATCATVIADTLPTAHFLYIRRDPAYTAQSILGARETIQGSRDVPYGVRDPALGLAPGGSPVEDVCAQVLYHERKMEEQRRAIGADRFWVVEYEAFCREPHRIVERAATEILGVTIDRDALRSALPPFVERNRVTIDPGEFAAIQATLARLDAPRTAREASM
jgi:hypothetical protein